jgi:hypothetical protein
VIRLFFGIDLHLVHGLKTVSPVDVLKAFAVGLLAFIKVKEVQGPVLVALQRLGLDTFGFGCRRGLGGAGAERKYNAQ